MITNIYELKKMNHAEELIHYLKHLVVPKSITRKTQNNINSQDLPGSIQERIFPYNSITQIINGSIEDIASVQLFV